MNKREIEKMVKEIIAFLKMKNMWETDTGIIYNGKHVDHRGETPKEESLKGVARMWFEGPLYRALNYGEDDKEYTIYNGLQKIMEKYGCFPEFDTACDFNIYEV